MTTIDLSRTDVSTRPSEGDLRNTIAAALRRWPSAGVAVAVVRGDSPVQYFCHGIADVASSRRISEDTVFRIGVALYVASRLFAPAEEADLANRFGRDWDAYCRRVKVPWL